MRLSFCLASLILLSCYSCGPFGAGEKKPCPNCSFAQEPRTWYRHQGDSKHWYLYYGNQLLGCAEEPSGRYWPHLGNGQYGGPTRAPSPFPFKVDFRLPDGSRPLFGAEPYRPSPSDRYSVQGNSVPREFAYRAIDGRPNATIPDDGKKPFLTVVVRNQEQRKNLESAFAQQQFAALKERYRVQVYDTSGKIDREMLKPFKLEEDERFQRDGRACYLQEPGDGRSKAYAAFYNWSSPTELIEGVRKIDPDWKPNDLPEGRRRNGGSWVDVLLEGNESLAIALVVLAVLVIAVGIRRRS